MQKKSYKPFPQLIVRLPRIKAPSAVTLGNGLRHAAETLDDLPETLIQAISLMVVTHQALVEVWVARLAAKKKDKKLQTIMRQERIAIRTLYAYLLGLAKLDSEITKEIAARAQTVIDVVFPSGMAFTTGNHAEVYAEMDRRFDAMNAGNLRSEIESLGGHILLGVVENNHRMYLEELGGGVVRKEKYEENLRELMEAFLARVRMLVVHTHAWLDVCPEREGDALVLLQTIDTIGKMKDGVSQDGGPSLAKILKQTASAARALTAKASETVVETAPSPSQERPEPSPEVASDPSPPPLEARSMVVSAPFPSPAEALSNMAEVRSVSVTETEPDTATDLMSPPAEAKLNLEIDDGPPTHTGAAPNEPRSHEILKEDGQTSSTLDIQPMEPGASNQNDTLGDEV